jgi:NADH-quinone oxidoreductase subunit J
MSAGGFLFLVCGIACLAGAVGTVASKSPVRAAVGLLTTILGIAGLFLKLSAQFLAAIQLIVYAGAVVVLFVFVIMLLGADAAPLREDKSRAAKYVSGVLLSLMALGAIVALLPSAGSATRFAPVSPEHGTVEAVGKMLFTDAIVPFELSTALLIVAVVGAIAVARGKQGAARPKRTITKPTDLFVGPLMARDDSGRPKETTP